MRYLQRDFWLLVAIACLVLGIHWINAKDGFIYQSDFLSPQNLFSLAQQIALLGVFALGAGIIIIAGGIDLSSGSVICFTGVICAAIPGWLSRFFGEWINRGIFAVDFWFASGESPRWLAWLFRAVQAVFGAGRCPQWLASWAEAAGLLNPKEPFSTPMLVLMIGSTLVVGLLIGLFHAFLINRLDLPPFIATLGTMAGLRSLASVITTGTIGMYDQRFRMLATEPAILFGLFLLECVLLAVLMRWTRLGRHIQALGGNESAARLSGLNIYGLKRFAYCLGALTATVAGLIYVAYNGTASPRTGAGYELAAIAAAVVGGCSLRGGAGSITGIVLGVVLLRIVINGTVFVIDTRATEWEGFIVGLVVILAVLLGKLGSRST